MDLKGKIDDLVFPSPGGRFIDFHNFRNRAWKTVLDSLPLVAKDVARLVGNSPEMIYKHYAGRKRELTVPEF